MLTRLATGAIKTLGSGASAVPLRMMATSAPSDLIISHDKINQKFKLKPSEDQPEAFVEYEPAGQQCVKGSEVKFSIMDLYHTYVPTVYRGKGYAGIVVQAAFDYARENGLKIIPSCTYISNKFVKEHPEYNDLLVTRDSGVREVSGAAQESKESSSEGEEEQEEPHGREHIFKLAYGQYLAIMAKGNPRINTLTQFAVLCSRRANDLIEERGWSTLPSHDPSLDIPDISPLTKIASSPFLCLQKSQSLLEQACDLDDSGRWISPDVDDALELLARFRMLPPSMERNTDHVDKKMRID